MEGDIPLRELQLLWQPDDKSLPPVKAMGINDKDDRNYSSSWGACNLEFNETDDAGRIHQLLANFAWMTVMDGVSPQALHDALVVVPEYRSLVHPSMLPDSYNED